MDYVTVKRRKPKGERKEASLRLRLTAAEKALWTRTAENAGRDLSNWLRFIANRASRGNGEGGREDRVR
jgi:uncharacterized protein (DUF1778 family)